MKEKSKLTFKQKQDAVEKLFRQYLKGYRSCNYA